ncbi:MAG TPA: Flp family type IVb pilin [Acidimicrobiales bacterium]|nr:Flp family type IVb pilin [Acidimicrobiales bacterium]
MSPVVYWHRHCAPYLRARLGRDDEGASLVEYALLLALIAMVCIIAVTFLGNETSEQFSEMGSHLQ